MINVINESIAAHHGNLAERKAYRDQVALLVLKEMIGTTPLDIDEERLVAEAAYRMADFMLIARERTEET